MKLLLQFAFVIKVGIIALIRIITGALFFFSSNSGTVSLKISFINIKVFLAKTERIEFINSIILGYIFNPYNNWLNIPKTNNRNPMKPFFEEEETI